MAEITITLTTEEAHVCELAIERRQKEMPDQTPHEKEMVAKLYAKLHKAYVDADWIDFKKSHPDT